MAQTSSTPTVSQFASAAMHMELRSEWCTVRINGERYVRLESGSSGHVYLLRADARACACAWYEKTGEQCSHMLALELAALEDELRETASDVVPSLHSYRDLFPGCVGGCGELVERQAEFCYRCLAQRTYDMDQQSKRERIETRCL